MQPQLAFAILIQADKHNRSKIKNACLASRLLKVPYNDIPESKLSKLSKHTLIELVSLPAGYRRGFERHSLKNRHSRTEQEVLRPGQNTAHRILGAKVHGTDRAIGAHWV